MSTVVHISDLHFGKLAAVTIDPLLDRIRALEPSVVVVSGDLTQRARTAQFRAAGEFLDRIPCKHRVVVPGNHDIPLWNPWRRFVNPRRDYRRYICAEQFPVYTDDNMVIVGLDTARSFTFSGGRVNAEQLVRVRSIFATHPQDRCRIVAAHHPFVVPEACQDEKIVGRSEQALSGLLEDNVDLLLTGHRHLTWTSLLGTRLLTIHSGTATSTRTRGEPNAFYELQINSIEIKAYPWHWQEQAGCFTRGAEGVHHPRISPGS